VPKSPANRERVGMRKADSGKSATQKKLRRFIPTLLKLFHKHSKRRFVPILKLLRRAVQCVI
jgi:predicted outer membrane protein